MVNKNNYRFIKLENTSFIKDISRDINTQINESINKSKLFQDNKKEELRKIENTKKLINKLLTKIKKLDSLLDKKAL